MKMVEFYSKNKKIINKLIFIINVIIFSALSIMIGLKHERWSDETQAWLIARDNNFLGIFKAIRYEGSPALWHLLLKFCIICGLEYKNLYFVTTILTLIGIFFLFKNEDIPLLFKILLPYTYFIFFQYTIVARSYCLMFPLLMAICYMYSKKEEHLIKYGILLILLMNVSSYGFIIAGSLWLEFLIAEIRKNKNIKSILKKEKIFFVIILIFLLGVVIYVWPASDCASGFSITLSAKEILNKISGSMFTSKSIFICNVIGTILVAILISNFYDNENRIRTSLLIFPTIIFIGIFEGKAWHIGLLFYVILVTAIINKSMRKKVVFIIFLISIIIQIYWNIVCCINDYKYDYSVGEEVAEYLKSIDYENKSIYAFDYWPININAYFEENIFENYQYAYYYWKESEVEESYDDILNDEDLDGSIYIIPICYQLEYNTDGRSIINPKYIYDNVRIMERLEESGKYEKIVFKGSMFYKNIEAESTSLCVFVKKEQ